MRRLGDLVRVLRAGRPDISSRAYSTASLGELAIAADLPDLVKDRKIFITAASRTAGQQGHMMTDESGAPVWRIELDTQHKWINGLMGWTSTADPLENVNRSNLVFQTKEAAIDYAEKYGLQYEVLEPNQRRKQRPKRYPGYGDNFSTKRKGLPAGGLPSEQEGGQKK